MTSRHSDQKKHKPGRYDAQAAEVVCLKCGYNEIVYIPREEIPRCPTCKKRMVVREILTEGKSY
jgi:rubrerythrin